MKKSLHGIVMLLAIAAATCIGAARASAGCCPNYSVDIQPSVPAGCFPLSVATQWSSTMAGSNSFTGPGVYTVPVPGPYACWGALTDLTIDGTKVTLMGVCPQTVALACGNVQLCVTANAGGCVTITIS